MKLTDLFLNTAVPLLLGAGLYAVEHRIVHMPLVRNYAADALWAYAFASAMLIVWQREYNAGWLAATFFAGILFEWLQHMQIIAGTTDILDLAAYAAGYSLALLLNNYFKHSFTT